MGPHLSVGIHHLVEDAGERPIARQQELRSRPSPRASTTVSERAAMRPTSLQVAFLRSSVRGYSIERSSGGRLASRPGVWP